MKDLVNLNSPVRH